jgi:uncharacterized protein YgfB (UPF0149 family)
MSLSDQYLQLESSLQLAGLHQPTSEVHGMIVGSIANHMYTSKAPNLLEMLVGNNNAEDALKPLQELLNEMYRTNSESLFENGENYELLLVDEDAKLSVRTESLADWCRGYLLGLLFGDVVSIDQLPEEGSEIVRDLLAISEAGPNDEEDEDEEDEWALAELEEYVKVGSQLTFESIVRFRSSQQPQAPVQ